MRFEEELEGRRDRLMNFEAPQSRRFWDGPHCHPILDDELLRRNPGLVESLHWPEGRPFAALLSHDVDGTRERAREQLVREVAKNFRGASNLTEKIKSLVPLVGLRHAPGYRDLLSPWLEAEEAIGARSTFFVFPTAVSRRHPRDLEYRWEDWMPFEGRLRRIAEVFMEIAGRGWEVGVHGSIESAFTPGMLREQAEDVARATGHPVVSGRQHNLQFSPAVTPALIAEAGLKVDCSLGSNRSAFFRTGTCYPHQLWSVAESRWLDVLEIPLVLHDGALMRWDNMDLAPDAAFDLCVEIIGRVAARRGVVSLLWHPENILKPGYFELYVRLLHHLKELNAWCAPARDIAKWWMESGNFQLVERARQG